MTPLNFMPRGMPPLAKELASATYFEARHMQCTWEGMETTYQLRKDLRTHNIIGAAMEVHRVRGTGFHEIVYRHCCMIEFAERDIPFVTEVPFPLTYKGHPVGGHYRADFVCYGEIIVELKATTNSNPLLETAQMLNYLAASGKAHGLLLNFGGPRLTFRRFVMSANGGKDVSES